MNLEPTPSPTGTPIIPPAAVPYVLALVGILAVAADTVDSGPLTTASVLRAPVKALTLLAVGGSPGAQALVRRVQPTSAFAERARGTRRVRAHDGWWRRENLRLRRCVHGR
jgi:hypothetical protein